MQAPSFLLPSDIMTLQVWMGYERVVKAPRESIISQRSVLISSTDAVGFL